MQDIVNKLVRPFGGAVTVGADGAIAVPKPATLASPATDQLADAAVFGGPAWRDAARWLLWELGQLVGVRPASIHDLYMARGQGKVHGFTVPAINIRGMAYDSARALFRAATKREAGAFICEIARSEMSYTDQRPAEYVAVLLAAALREGFRGPLFVQGDHFQANAKKYAADPEGEIAAIKALIKEAVAAGFYNIDIDTSTLVDLKQPTLDTQQRVNYERAAELTAVIRAEEPRGVTISVGAEIGEVGGKNSTIEDQHTFMDGYIRTLKARGATLTGISKISVQTGTSHGGVVLPDGSIAEVKLDLDTLKKLSEDARKKYGMAGAVQHGASTLPPEAFVRFPEVEAAEIHLATAFQSLLFDHEATPAAFKAKIYDWLRENAANERKTGETDEQFFYKTRKKALGPFKKDWWSLPEAVRGALGEALEDQFSFLFEALKVSHSAEMVARYVKAPELRRAEPAAAMAAAPDDAEAGE
ncbi:MAG TPA: class II fructose-bisphosphate aldolase [Gemmatimonadales bacterium]|nr:class II fructose-bisphosphate aldolase [Gemmatimonadales bacterium]